MHYLFKLAVKNIFIKPKSIQYKYGEIKIIDQHKDKDETLLESLYMVRVSGDETFIHKNGKRKDGGKQT